MLNSRVSRVLSWVLLACCFVGACVFLEQNIDQQIDADISSDLVHAHLVAKEGKLLTEDWYYSTEIRVVHVYLLFAPLFHLFEDWHVVRVLGSILWYLALLLSAYYVCYQCRMKRVFPIVGIVLLLPLSTPYYDNFIKGIFYVPYVSASFIVFGMTLHTMHVKISFTKVVLLMCVTLLSLVLGMSGMRVLLMLCAPLTAAAVVQMGRKKNKIDREEKCFLMASVMSLIGGIAGCGLNMTALAKKFSFLSFTDLYFVDFSLENVIRVLNDWLAFWGYRGGLAFSKIIIHNALALLLIFSLFFAVWRCVKIPDVPYEQQLLMLMYGTGMIIYVALFAVTNMAYHNTYHLPLSLFGLILSLSIIDTGFFEKRWRQLCAWLMILALIGCGALEYRKFSHIDRTAEFRVIANQLVEEDYSAGYGPFWCGNILTELSDGKLDMYVWDDYGTEDVNEMYHWLQEKRHDTETPEGRVCVVLEAKVADRYPVYQWLSEDKLIYSGDHLVYGFESYDEMIAHIEMNQK